MNFLCFDTEDNSKELLLLGKSGFDKSVTQCAVICDDSNRYYCGTPYFKNWDKEYKGWKFKDALKGYKELTLFRNSVPHTIWVRFQFWCDDLFAWQNKYSKKVVKQFKERLQKFKCKYFYAHNLQYDLGNLFSDKLDDLDVTMVGARLIKAVWGNKIFVDSYNIWPMSVKKLGTAFGLQKLETESMATDKEYVYRDVEIINKAMLFAWQFADGLGLKNLPPTLGGLCVKVWKHLGGVNNHDSHEMSRAALFGGRVELFSVCDDRTWELNKPEHIYAYFHGKANISDLKLPTINHDVIYTDINSLYPAMMLKEYPGELETWEEKRMPKFGIAECTVFQPKTDIPILPYRGKDGRILYPTGTFRGIWTTVELEAFKRNGGRIIKRHKCIGTDESSKPYEQFVLKLYDLRMECGNEAEKLFYKLIMNNLFGRLGTGGEIGRSVWQTDENKYKGIPYGEKVLVNYKMPLSDETNWCHAAYVTAYGRLELWKYLKLIGVTRLIYCDTDSCVFNSPGGKLPFKVGKELGQMKLEGKESIAFAFAPKMYRLGKYYKAKGVPVGKAQAFIEHGKAQFDLPFKMREAMRFFDRKNSKRLSVWRRIEKVKATDYDRKKLIGNKFYPCNINEA